MPVITVVLCRPLRRRRPHCLKLLLSPFAGAGYVTTAVLNQLAMTNILFLSRPRERSRHSQLPVLDLVGAAYPSPLTIRFLSNTKESGNEKAFTRGRPVTLVDEMQTLGY